ncbi:hypothetical protein D9M71_192050 [compost metagenome]
MAVQRVVAAEAVELFVARIAVKDIVELVAVDDRQMAIKSRSIPYATVGEAELLHAVLPIRISGIKLGSHRDRAAVGEGDDQIVVIAAR